MLSAADLTRDGKLLPDAIARAAGAGDLAQALAAASDGAHAAALAIATGIARHSAAQATLITLLDRDDGAGPAAAWALAQLDSEAAVIAAIGTGGIDTRTNGYHSLAIRAALGTASPRLAPAMTERVAAEIARAKQKLTGLGEHALKVLAILGTPGTDSLIQQVLENDPFTDKFELQRLRKAVSDGGRDRESQHALTQPWAALFADQCFVDAPPAAAKPAPEAKPVAKPAAPKAPPAAQKAAPPVAPAPAAPPVDDGGDGQEPPMDGDAPAATPIDWKAFADSPEATALPPAVKDLAGKLGPLLEQLAARAINAPLTDLSGQEFVGLLLQVLPQALPPQHVQAALSPQALHGYQALAKYLSRTGLATHGEDLLQGIAFVREQLKAQIRKSGILGGPDYSDPDEKASVSP